MRSRVRKTNNLRNSRIFFGILVVIFLSFGCTSRETVPGHYTPGPDAVLNIEFDYPQEWGVLSATNGGSSYWEGQPENKAQQEFKDGLIRIYDPSIPAPPCVIIEMETGIEDEGCHDQRAYILLRVWDIDVPSNWAADEVTFGLSHISANETDTLLEDKAIVVDNIAARMITWSAIFGERGVTEKVVFVDVYIQKDRTGYLFTLSWLPLQHLNESFHQSFLDILGSIEFVD